MDDHYADIAASAQQVTEEVIVTAARALQRRTGQRRLCMAGGVALNVLANARVLAEAGFDDLFIQPAAGDAGACIGAATYLYHHILGRPRTDPMRHAYLGPAVADADAQAFLDEQGIRYEVYEPGQLIVCTPREAYNCFAHTNIDLLVLGNAVVRRAEKRPFDPFAGRRQTREEAFALTG